MNKHSNHSIISIASFVAPKKSPFSILNGGDLIHVYDAKFIRMLSQAFHIPYKIVLNPDGAAAIKSPDGKWTGVLGMLETAEADLAVGGILLTEERFQNFNFSYPYIFSDVSFITNKPEVISTSMTLLYPFSFAIWMTLIGFVLSVSFFLVLLNGRGTYSNTLFNMFGSVLEKSINIKKIKSKLKLLIASWLLSMLVITNSYKALLLAFLSFPPLVGIENIEDLAEAADRNSVTCYTMKGSANTKIFLESNLESWQSIGKCLQRNKQSSENDIESFLRSPGKKAFIGTNNFLNSYTEEYFASKATFFNSMGAIPTSRNFCCLKQLDKIIHWIFAAGLIQKVKNDENFIKELSNKHAIVEESDTPKSIGIGDFKGAFLILIFGYILASVTLLIEIISKRTFGNVR